MQQSRKDLIDHLRDQLTFLRVSGAAFDDGAEAEAKRLAVATRVLVHGSRSGSHSLLRLLGLKVRLKLIDTIPGDPHGVPGLAMAEWDGDVWRGVGRWVAEAMASLWTSTLGGRRSSSWIRGRVPSIGATSSSRSQTRRVAPTSTPDSTMPTAPLLASTQSAD